MASTLAAPSAGMIGRLLWRALEGPAVKTWIEKRDQPGVGTTPFRCPVDEQATATACEGLPR